VNIKILIWRRKVMQNNSYKRILTFTIIVLFIGTSFLYGNIGIVEADPEDGLYYFVWNRQIPFDISHGYHECSYEYYYNGVLSKVRAWDNGSSTMYTTGYFTIKLYSGGPYPEPITVEVTIDHSGNGDGCSSIHLLNPYTPIIEKCRIGSINTYEVELMTYTLYRIETNAQAISRNGEVVEYQSILRLNLQPVPDNHPPTVTITFPEPYVAVTGDNTIHGAASDLDGDETLVRVEVKIDDGSWIETSGTMSWNYEWNTNLVECGAHTIYARSYDGEDYSTEESVVIKVSNGEDFPQGKGIWIVYIWYLGDSVSEIIDICNKAGVSWVLIKCGDSDSNWLTPGHLMYNWIIDEGYNDFSEIITEFNDAGIDVYAWQYTWSYDRWDIPDIAEADVSIQILDISGLEGLIINAEEYWEDSGDDKVIAEQDMLKIRMSNPDSFIAYSYHPYIQSHPNYPFKEFGKYCDLYIPQAYWKVHGNSPKKDVEKMESHWNQYKQSCEESGEEISAKYILPAGQGYDDVKGSEIKQFCGELKKKKYDTVCLYLYAGMNEKMWEAYGECFDS
jgi:hypothetical protein